MSSQQAAKLIAPFPGWRPRPEQVAQVASPPYDVLSRDEARLLATGNPCSFLHVSKAEIDLADGVASDDPAVYQQARQRWRQWCEQGLFVQDAVPCLYIYRLMTQQRQQIGVVAAASVDAYLNDRIKRHELTRADKENDRTRLSDSLSAHSGPVFLTYRQSRPIDLLVAQLIQSPPVYDFCAADGVQHTFWVVQQEALVQQLVAAFENLPSVYIADGHHRSAAAARVCQTRRAQRSGSTGREGFNRFLAVLFPDSQVNILDYNRVVRDLNGLTGEQFLAAVGERFTVESETAPVRPRQRHQFGLYLAGHGWYRLDLKPGLVEEHHPVGRLDVRLLEEHLLRPVLAMTDLRHDRRIDFVGGSHGLERLMARVDRGDMAAAFVLHPTQLEELFTVADAGMVMPPKSTWFEPKLCDGLVVQAL
ncbi:MAG: DUF1015 domain-containing protein [Magnetococcales bacterium]|nr:DUF1015 domain-containing protein [Magnetococcales bacterium]